MIQCHITAMIGYLSKVLFWNSHVVNGGVLQFYSQKTAADNKIQGVTNRTSRDTHATVRPNSVSVLVRIRAMPNKMYLAPIFHVLCLETLGLGLPALVYQFVRFKV
jgi:hypothetical protein